MDIGEIRRKFPQYDDIPDAELLAAIHRKFYADMPADDFMARLGQRPAESPEQPRRTVGQEAGRQAALAGRSVVTGLTSLPNIVGDAANAAINYGIRGVNALGGNVPELPLPSAKTQELMTRAGMPVPESGAEKFTSAVNSAVTGFAPWIKGAQMAGSAAQQTPMLRTMLTQPAAETAAVATGAGASNLTEQAGGGPVAQMVAGAVAPMAVSGAVGTVKAAGKGINEIRRPVTQKGAEQIAADTIGRLTQDKTTALTNLHKYNTTPGVGVPGSKPTAAAVAGDYGLAGAEQLISRGDNNPLFAVRQAQNNAARLADLAKLNATKKALELYETKRDNITAPLREAAFAKANKPVDFVPVAQKIAAVADSPEGRRVESQKALEWLAKRINYYVEKGWDDAESAYGLHKDIGALVAGKVNSNEGPIRLAGGLANDVKKTLFAEISKAAPGFDKYMRHYARLSKPIERLEVITERLGGQDLRGVTNATPMVTSAGADFVLSQAKMRNAVADIGENTRLAPRQSDVLSRVSGELNADVFASRGGKQPGSDTYQNIASANFVRRMLGDTLAESGVGRLVQSPLNLVNRPFEARVNDLVTKAFLDPKYMEELLRKARTSRGSPTLTGLLDYSAPRAAGGLLGSILQ